MLLNINEFNMVNLSELFIIIVTISYQVINLIGTNLCDYFLHITVIFEYGMGIQVLN